MMQEPAQDNQQKENAALSCELNEQKVEKVKEESFSGSLFTDHDIYLFKEGTHFRLFEKMGAHLVNKDGVDGVYFSVWAPNA